MDTKEITYLIANMLKLDLDNTISVNNNGINIKTSNGILKLSIEKI